MFGKKYKDDCDGAAILGIWALKKYTCAARIIELFNIQTNKGHMICVSKDNRLMISNNFVVKMGDNEWKQYINQHFNYQYNVLIDGWKIHKLKSIGRET